MISQASGDAAAAAAAAAAGKPCSPQKALKMNGLRALDDSSSCSSSCSSSYSSSSSDEGDVSSVCTLEDDESQEESPAACCLLCSFRCSTAESSSSSSSSSSLRTPAAVVLQHMREQHGLDLAAKKNWLAADTKQQLPPLNTYTRIALVTFLRQQQQQHQQQQQRQQHQQQHQQQQQQQVEFAAAVKALHSLTPTAAVFCCPEELLHAADADDPLLWDGDEGSSDDEPFPDAAAAAAAAAGGEAAAAAAAPLPEAAAAGTAAAAAAAAAARSSSKGYAPPVSPHNTPTYEKLLQYRTRANSSSSSSSSSKREDDGAAAAADEGAEETAAETPEDRGYFAGYGELAIHREMISDAVRTEAYRNFILQQAEKLRGKVVLDVGCGSGVLSLFAAQAGARKVIAVDASAPIVSVARRIVAANGFSQTVQVVHAKVAAEGSPPAGSVALEADALVSEWMGYALLYEGMLYSVLEARDKYLKTDGLIIPNKALISVCTADLREEQQLRRGPFESLLYELDFSALRLPDDHLFGQLEVGLVQQQHLNQQQQQQQQPLCLLDLQSITREQLRTLRFPINVSLPQAPEVCSSLVLSFDCFFEPRQQRGGPAVVSFAHEAAAAAAKPAEGAIVMSTSPLTKPTHWKQTVLHLLDGDGSAWSLSATPETPGLKGFLSINPDPNPASRRSIVVTLELNVSSEAARKPKTIVRAYPMQ